MFGFLGLGFRELIHFPSRAARPHERPPTPFSGMSADIVEALA